MNDFSHTLGRFSDCLFRCTVANMVAYISCSFFDTFHLPPISYQKLNSAPTKGLIRFGYTRTISGVKNHENIRFGLFYKRFANMAVSVYQTTFDSVQVHPNHIARTYTNGYGSGSGTPLYIRGVRNRIG